MSLNVYDRDSKTRKLEKMSRRQKNKTTVIQGTFLRKMTCLLNNRLINT